MSLAKKCDICGKYYEDYSIVFKNEKINAFVFVETDEKCRYNCSKDTTDCCPECLSSITHHIRMLETKHSSDSKSEITVENEGSECDGNYNLWEPKEKGRGVRKMKVKIMSSNSTYELEKLINDFIKDKELIDIKYSILKTDGVRVAYYSALIIYDEYQYAPVKSKEE